MPLTEIDYLNWYNKEIDRYRDHEWQLLAFSMGITSAIFLFLVDKDTTISVPLGLFTSVMIIITLIFILIECFTHWQLNKKRFERDQILKPYAMINKKAKIVTSPSDTLFFALFLLAPLIWNAILYYLVLRNEVITTHFNLQIILQF